MSAPSTSLLEQVLDDIVGFLKGIDGPTACVAPPHFYNSVHGRVLRYPEAAPAELPCIFVYPAPMRAALRITGSKSRWTT